MSRDGVSPAERAPAERGRRRVSVLGATGSVGQSTLNLIARGSNNFEVVALTANSNAKKLAELAIASRARLAVVGEAGC